MQMGAAAKTSSQNNLGKKKKRFQGVKKGQNKNRPPSLFANVSRPPFPPPTIGMVRGMRRPPPFPPGRMHPGMRPIPPPGPTMRGPMPPPPLMRGPPGRIPPPPPMGMRPPPGVRPPPMMRPMPPPMIPPMGAPRPFGPAGGPVPLMGVPPRGRLGNRPGMKGKKFNKKKNSKNSSNEEVDLKKPWITDEIKSEYSKKQDLLKTARESKKKEDWDSYKEQREKCYKMFNTAKLEYIGKHPEEVRIPQLCPSQPTPQPHRLRHTASIDFTKDVEL